MNTTISSYQDWGRLKEIILGSPANLTLPTIDRSLEHFFEPPVLAVEERIDTARMERVKQEMEEDFLALAAVLEARGVVVRRPDPIALDTECVTPHWRGQQSHALMPRDCLAVIGNNLIEAPMPARARFFESMSFRPLVREYFEGGANWISAPRPVLTDEVYQFDASAPWPTLAEHDPLFDAANLIRCGKDVFFNISNTGNQAGYRWLKRVLGSSFNVHPISICSDHVGTTIHLLCPGVILANASRLDINDIPSQLRHWKIIWFDKPLDDGYGFDWPRASVWIGMNILSLDENTVIVPSNQEHLIRQLEHHQFDVIPVRFRHGRTVGGGFHCCSLDVRREGDNISYL
jgi:glycine amidinotransferase